MNAPDLESANKALPRLMRELPLLVNRLNGEQGASISVIKVDLKDAQGRLLLKYMYDLELETENWWQADGLSRDWFPHPPSPSAP